MPRYVASVQYDGSGYHGWQKLKSKLPTVQEVVENAVSQVADHSVSVVCSGRTDSGVHGCNQIIHFDSDAVRSDRGWTFGSNTHLPDDVAINWVRPVSEVFHARFSALWRRYRYIILNRPVRPAHLSKGVTWNFRPLDEIKMRQAADYLVGEHNFNAYRAVQCQAKNPVRRVSHLNVVRRGDVLVIDIQANAFLHHMVRNIAGVLMAIGSGKNRPEWALEILKTADRTQGGVTAPPYGLYFLDVGYPDEFQLPEAAANPFFLPQNTW